MTDMGFYLHRFIRKLHWLFALCLLGGLIGVGTSLLRPATYESEARLLLNGGAIAPSAASSATNAEPLELVRERVLHRDRLLNLATRLGIYAGQFPDPNDDDIVTDMRDRITIALDDGPASITMITVGFTGSHPLQARETTDHIVAAILSEDQQARQLRTDQRLDYFSKDAKRLGDVLAAQEAKLLTFMQQHEDALPETLGSRRDQLLKAKDRLALIERQIAAFQAEARGPEDIAQDATLTPDQSQLLQLEKELAARSTLMSPENPKLQLLNLQTETLRKRLSGRGPVLPVSMEAFTNGRSGSERLADLMAQKIMVSDTLDRLATSIEKTAANGMKLAKLEQTQEQIRTRYAEAIKNLERAETSDLIEALGHAPRLTLFETATLPTKPLGFGTAKMGLAGIAGGFMVALFLITLSETTTNKIRRPEDLTNALGIVPFATVPQLRTRPTGLRQLGGVAAIAGVCLLAGISVWMTGKNLDAPRIFGAAKQFPAPQKES